MSGEYGTVEETAGVKETSAAEGQVIMPFYFICDVSGSMHGDIHDLNAAVKEFVVGIQSDPVVDDLVMLSIITFNHNATTVVPLSSPSDMTPPVLSASGGTNYSAAFEEYNRSFEKDRADLKSRGIKVFRPCVFFLTDGAPGDRDHLKKFKSLFGYDPESKQGNAAFPYFVPYGFRDAPEAVIRALAYPDFGRTKGRWFLFRSNRVGEVLKTMAAMLGNTVISSGQSVAKGQPQLTPPSPPAGSDVQFGEAGDYV
jgi:uncharacterized protein YegL